LYVVRCVFEPSVLTLLAGNSCAGQGTMIFPRAYCAKVLMFPHPFSQCELEIVQSSLLGSILSNLLLVLGCCFLAAGLRFSEVGFQAMCATSMFISVLELISRIGNVQGRADEFVTARHQRDCRFDPCGLPRCL
jgi:calcium/proton exchanger cax